MLPTVLARVGVWAILAVFFNTADAILTLYALHLGAQEANPLMELLIVWSPLAFLIYKLAVVNTLILGISLMDDLSRSVGRFVEIALFASAIIYGCVVLYHIFHLAS